MAKSALVDMQVAVIKYLRESIGVLNVGDCFPQDNNLTYFVHLKEANVADISNKHNIRARVSFTFHCISEDTTKFLEILDAVQSLATTESLLLEAHNIDDVNITMYNTFVDTQVEKQTRNGVIQIEFDLTQN